MTAIWPAASVLSRHWPGLLLFGCLEGDRVMNLDVALRESIVRICGVSADQITAGSTLEDLGVDSLAAAEIITDVEIRTGIELPMDVLRGLSKMRTFAEVAAHLQAGAERPPVPSEP
jgi:acyl carrier protein